MACEGAVTCIDGVPWAVEGMNSGPFCPQPARYSNEQVKRTFRVDRFKRAGKLCIRSGVNAVTDEVMKFQGVHIISIRRVEANRVEAFV